ncbi:MAG: hypothetical protein R3A44_40275 [Caldilineaceae bacterium]
MSTMQEAWVERLPRLIGEQSHPINYRHVIESAQAGRFRRYRFREDLFPRLIFRLAWEQLNQWHTPRKADIIYLQILHLAARTWKRGWRRRRHWWRKARRRAKRMWSACGIGTGGGALPGSQPSTCTIMTSCSRRCFMSQHEQLRTYCKSLRLPSLSEVLVETLAFLTRITVHRDLSPPPAGTRGRGQRWRAS